jgi:uncharacterized protein involved in exopolysaccharide biosynthesis
MLDEPLWDGRDRTSRVVAHSTAVRSLRVESSPATLNPPQAPHLQQTFGRWVDYLKRVVLPNKRLFLASFVLSLSVMSFYILAKPPLYSSSTYIYVDPRHSQFDGEHEYNGDFALASGLIESQVQLIRSERTALAVIDRLGMAPIDAANGPSLLSRLRSKLGLARFDQSDEATAMRAAIDKLQSNLKVKRLSQTFVVEVTYVSRDASIAKEMSQAFAQAYIEELLDSTKQSTKLASDWLRTRLEDLRDRSRAADRAIQQFRSTGDSADPVVLNDLESQSQVARVAYENFLRRFTDIAQQQSFPVTAARIASDASIPEPIGPGRSILAIIAVLLAAAVGVGATAWRDLRRNARTEKEAPQ